MTVWIAATAFIATNVDDLFLLTLWFAKRSRFSVVLLGQLVGFTAILFLCLVGYWGLQVLPAGVLHWLGLAPIAIGIKQLFSSTDKNCQAPAESTWSVASITFANGSDNLAVYTPLLSRSSPWRVGLIAMTFYLLLFLSVIAAHFAASRLKPSDEVHKSVHRIAPVVIIGIGVLILLSR
jgi:cadmium resistance protein CadD (predicted permease)